MDTGDLQTIYTALQTGPFAAMSEAERQKLAQHARLQPFSLGATLFREGEAATDPMLLLSGNMTPLKSMPTGLQWGMHLSPSVYYVAFTQALLYRGATLAIVWPELLVMAGLGIVFLAYATHRFRVMLSQIG